MMTVDELRAKQAADLAKLQAEHALANALPVAPERLLLTSGGLAPWATYEAESLVDALALIGQLGEVVPFYRYKSTFTRLQPEALATDKSGDVVSGPYALSLAVSQGEGFGPDAVLKAFYRLASGEIVQARVALRPAGYGPAQWWQYGAQRITRSGGGYRREAVVLEWRANNALAALSDDHVKWGTGSDDSASFEYLWATDDVDGGTGHATGQLWTLAEEARRATFRCTPMVESFLSVMLEDMQITESEEATIADREARDVGTIWTCPESTFRFARDAVRRFESALRSNRKTHNPALDAAMSNDDRAGADLYLVMAGHGAGFADRDCWSDDSEANAAIAARLSEVAGSLGGVEAYLGDDGRAYVMGAG